MSMTCYLNVSTLILFYTYKTHVITGALYLYYILPS